jgi:hypothetical protein
MNFENFQLKFSKVKVVESYQNRREGGGLKFLHLHCILINAIEKVGLLKGTVS